MTKLEQHPSVRRFRQQPTPAPAPRSLDSEWLERVCRQAGADDSGFVEIDRPALMDQRSDLQMAFPGVRSLISFVCRMNREPIRTPARSVANLEFHQVSDRTNEVARRIVSELENIGVRAMNGAAGFPMEAERWGEKMWFVSHKPVAVAAGLGHMGIHRNVIHSRFGSFVLLGTVLLDATLSRYTYPIDYNPCLECKLCVAACPTGAISSDGRFNFSACYTHNYREFMGGFSDWVETITESRNIKHYEKKFSSRETVSMWQSLSFGANYKAAYCIAVCPAGDEVIGPFLTDRKTHFATVVRPLQEKMETVYVVPGSDAEDFVRRRFEKKKVKRVKNTLPSPASIRAFLFGLPLVFQPGKAGGLESTYHFRFKGKESTVATVRIHHGQLEVMPGNVGKPNLVITADSETWLRFLRKKSTLVGALLSRKIRLKGPPRLLRDFGQCFLT